MMVHLRVLILGRNQITKISNLDSFPNLDFLDLHDNRIKKVENLNKLNSLRVLNLSSNMIDEVKIDHPMRSLVELNLRKNSIVNIGELRDFPSLQKLYLSNNKLTTFDNVGNLPLLSDLTLENNPIVDDKSQVPILLKLLREKYQSLNFFNLQRVSTLCSEAVVGIAEKINEQKNKQIKEKEQLHTPQVKRSICSGENGIISAVINQRKEAKTASKYPLAESVDFNNVSSPAAPINYNNGTLPTYKPKN